MRTTRLISRVIAVMQLFALGSCTLSSDAALEKSFYRHDVELERLRELFAEERRFREVTTRFTRPSAAIGSAEGMPYDRFNMYRSYFTAIGISGVLRRDDGAILFTANAVGALTKARYKGYAYLSASPVSTYDQLDQVPDTELTDCDPHYKHIKGRWYLYAIDCL